MQDWWQITFPKGRQTLEITDADGDLIKIAYGSWLRREMPKEALPQ